MANFIAYSTGTTTGSADFSQLSTVSYTRTIYLNVNGTQQKSWIVAGGAIPSDSYIANFTGLSPSTTYQARCNVYRNSPWELVYSNTYDFTTLAPSVSPMANFIAYPVSSIRGRAEFSDLSTVNYRRMIFINVDGTQEKSWLIDANATPSSVYTSDFFDLSPNTTYTAQCIVYRTTDWEIVYSNTASFTTLAPSVSPWEWHNPKVSGEDFNVTFGEWNGFCARINQMRNAKGLGAYTFTTAISGNPFYATMFKEAVNALDGFGVAAELKTVTSGSRIYAWYFTNLKASLNNAISTI